jgi:GDPmannose 4,6-dehydratase
MTKRALILGITGQDGSYLSEILLDKGYEVHGVIRRSSFPNTQRIDNIFDPESKQFLHYGDLSEGIDGLLYELQPDEVYNLAAMSHVRISFDMPVYTMDINASGPCRILEGIKKVGLKNKTRFYQASSSEMFGITPPPQNETSVFQPVSPYGAAKLAAYHLTKCYRKGYGMFAANGILFNHESPRRGVNFVTRKITRLACKIKLGLLDHIELGNLDAERDWGFSKDYMEAVHLILQYDKPDDFVISTGEMYTVRSFAENVFQYLGMDFYKYLKTNEIYTRPNEVPQLLGDSTKARTLLNWKPKTDFHALIKMMVDNDMGEAKNEVGFNTY